MGTGKKEFRQGSHKVRAHSDGEEGGVNESYGFRWGGRHGPSTTKEGPTPAALNRESEEKGCWADEKGLS